MELGIYTFADVPVSSHGSNPEIVRQRLDNLLEEIILADTEGLDVFGVGEHHRPDYAVSSPAVVLAAAAVKTKNIRLTSAVTVLSSDDPVRVFQQFATVDLLSGGRAEIMAGRGSFIESFPLFGYRLDDYDELFAEKLQLLLQLNDQEQVTWKGTYRPGLEQRGVYPRPLNRLPVWVAVGGTPESVMRAALLKLPLALAIIGGAPEQFRPLVNLYRKTAGTEAKDLKLSINSHAFVAPTGQEARDIFFPYYAEAMSRIGRERGWLPVTRQQFDAMCGPQGSLLVGSPEEVTEKILYEHRLFRHDRFLAQMDVGAVPHEPLMQSIALFAAQVAPAVRKALGDS